MQGCSSVQWLGGGAVGAGWWVWDGEVVGAQEPPRAPSTPQHMREAAERRQQLELEHEQALAVLNAKQQEIELLQKVSCVLGGWGILGVPWGAPHPSCSDPPSPSVPSVPSPLEAEARVHVYEACGTPAIKHFYFSLPGS